MIVVNEPFTKRNFSVIVQPKNLIHKFPCDAEVENQQRILNSSTRLKPTSQSEDENEGDELRRGG